jgi:hypothetical protein
MIIFNSAAWGRAWKVLPKGVRILGYRNVITNQITKNFNSQGQESTLGASFKVDASTFNEMTNNMISSSLDPSSYNNLVVGEYKVDAGAQFHVQGTGFGWGLTDRVMFYAELAYYKAIVKANIQRTAGNTYEQVARASEQAGGLLNNAVGENLRNMIDANESTVQSVITNYYGYKPIGDWYGSGYGDMETGFMTKLIDRGYTGLLFYPGVILPTGRVDDPDILQDIGFGNGNVGIFGEIATGYVLSDKFSLGATLRYTSNLSTQKNLRIPEERDFQLSTNTGSFDVKYGDKINSMLNSTITFNDWFSLTPTYRFLYQLPAKYDSDYKAANKFLAYNSHRIEHQAQLTASISSITPFLKKEFILPAQININAVRTISGINVPSQSRFEVELRMLF